MAQRVGVYEYPDPLTLPIEDQEAVNMVREGFSKFDIVNNLLKVKMEEWTIEGKSDWFGFVDAFAEPIEDAFDRKRFQTWKFGAESRSSEVDLQSQFDAKSSTFVFTVRAYKRVGDTYYVKEGIVKSDVRVHHTEIKRGAFGSVADFFTGTLGGYATAQETQDKKERKLHAALAKGSILSTYIGTDWAAFLSSLGISVAPISQEQWQAQQEKIQAAAATKALGG